MLRCLIVLSLLFIPLPVNAQEFQSIPKVEEHITGLDIEDHFKKVETIYTGTKPDMQSIRDFVKNYPTDGFTLKDIVTTNKGSGKPVFLEKNKEQFIEDETDRYYELKDTRIRHTLTNIRYLDDKVSAEVSYTALFQGYVKMNLAEKGLVFINFKSLSVCTDILKLVNSEIKGYRADCKTDIIYGDATPAK